MDSFLESIKEKNEADFTARLFSKNSDDINLERITDVLNKNKHQARRNFLKKETNLAEKSLDDALRHGLHLGLLYKKGNLYCKSIEPSNPTDFIQANMAFWDSRRLFFYKMLSSPKFTAKQKAEYLAPCIRYVKNRAGEAELIGDKIQKQGNEHYVNYYFALAREYHFDRELDDALKQLINPNEVQSAKNLNDEMLKIYEKLTSTSQLQSDLKLTKEIYAKLIQGQKISKFEE